MEYLILTAILLGAIYLLVRAVKREKSCGGGSGSCDHCSRAAQPPAERLHQIELPPKN